MYVGRIAITSTLRQTCVRVRNTITVHIKQRRVCVSHVMPVVVVLLFVDAVSFRLQATQALFMGAF